MRKSVFLLFFICLFSGLLYSQVGINTENPRGIFHIDGASTAATTNPSSGNVTAAQARDDVYVNAQGNVGIGTITPDNKLVINNTGNNTGLKLPNGASSGKVLTSDTQGNAVWVSGAVQYQTLVEGTGGNTLFTVNNPSIRDNTLITFFNRIVFDRARDIYGVAYGWDMANQQYVAPVTGIYRIAMNMYFTAVSVGQNHRVYTYRNGSILYTSGIISITDSGMDQAAFVMGLVSLNQGDRIDFRVQIAPGPAPGITTPMATRLWGGAGHSYILIESL